MAINISIIGGGNVAYHLTKALYQLPEVHLRQLYNRSEFSPEVNDFQVDKIHSLTDYNPFQKALRSIFQTFLFV